MAVGVTWEFSKGDLKNLQKKADKLNRNLQRKVYQAAIREASKETLSAAKSASPSSTVARALTARVASKPRNDLYGMKITVRGGVFRDKRVARRRGVGATYFPNEAVRFYRFLERGWNARGRGGNRRPGRNSRFIPARPFLFKSLSATSGAVIRKSSIAIKAGLEKFAGK